MKTSPTYNDAALLSLIREGLNLNQAIRSIYEQYAEKIGAYIRKNSGTRQDAEDIFQETVVSFIEIVKKNAFREQATIGTFLMSIARNLWMNELKKRTRTGFREELFQNSREELENDISSLLVDREMKQQFREVLGRLGENCKKILMLFYYNNLSMKEIVMHVPYENEQVVRNKKHKCLQQLSDMMRSNPSIKASINYPHE